LSGLRGWRDALAGWLQTTSRRVRNGIFTSVALLEAAFTEFPRVNNAHPRPLIWRAAAAALLTEVARAKAALLMFQNSPSISSQK